MEIDQERAELYLFFLADKSQQIRTHCNQLDDWLQVAKECIDPTSSRDAIQQLQKTLESLKASVPISENAGDRIAKALKKVHEAEGTFGGRSR